MYIKNQMSSVDISAVVSELQMLIDAKLDKAYQHTPNEIRLKLQLPGSGRQDLLIEAGKRIHVTKYPRPSPKIAPSFPMLLRKHLMGGRITAIKQYDFDRIIEIHILRGDTIATLVVELFSKGNVILLDENRRIIMPLKSMSFKDREVRRGEQYEFPPSLMNPMDITNAELCTLLDMSNRDVVRTLASKLNIGGLYAEEICIRAGVDKNTLTGDLTKRQSASIHSALHGLFEPIISGTLKPHIVLADDAQIDVFSFELRQYEKHEKKYFTTFNEALDEFFSKQALREVEGVGRKIKDEKLSVVKRMLERQEDAIKSFEQLEKECIEKAELIYAHYQHIDEVFERVRSARKDGHSWSEIKTRTDEIIEIDEKIGDITIKLDGASIALNVKLTIPQNAKKYYLRAKELRKKREGALRALERTKKEVEQVMLGHYEPEYHLAPQRKIRQKSHWYDRFRWFTSSDGFLVVGGRDADTNEDIVKKYMKKDDIFFHAEAHGAPVTVIKTEGKDVPEATLSEAAQFAVSYSSVWKAGHYEGACYWVHPEQVSKTPETGEYIGKGSFVIRGKRNYIKAAVGVAIGIEIDEETDVIGGPSDAIKKRAKYVIELEPGDKSQNHIAKELSGIFLEKAEPEDKYLVKSIASPDKIAPFLPPGASNLKNGR